MFGSHLSIAGGLHNALISARALGMQCVQVFTRNQRQWRCAPLEREEIELWQQHLRSTRLRQTVSHDSYLINLASPSGDAWKLSMNAFREELLRCEQLGIPNLVTHPGAHMGSGDEAGLGRVAEALDQLHRDLPGLGVVTCLEITAGQGSSLGHRLEHLASIIDRVKQPERLGVCLDTAHLFAAGYDLCSAAGARAVLEEIDAVVGLKRVRVVHVNDSKTGRGSRVDRHEHIGRGLIAREALAVFVRHPHLRTIPKILETPKGKGPRGREWDAINLDILKGLRTSPADRPSR